MCEQECGVLLCLIVKPAFSCSRLIMNAHRDLEAFKRLNYRKAKPAGKAPMPYTSKRAGALPPGDQPWRDL